MKYFFIACLFCFFSCNDSAKHLIENQELKLQLVEKQKQIEQLKQDEDRKLIHIVYFDLKPEANKKVFIKALEKLGEIPVVDDLEIGQFKDLADKRALSEFEIMMQMEFDSEKEYTTYQEHPTHLELKSLAAKFVAAPPVTYDYVVVE